MENNCFFGMEVFYFWQRNSCSMICGHIVPDTDFNKNNCVFHFDFLWRKTTTTFISNLKNLNFFMWIIKHERQNLHWFCLEVEQNDRFGVDELVDPIRQTLQSPVTGRHKLWTPVTMFWHRSSAQDLVQIFTQHELWWNCWHYERP